MNQDTPISIIALRADDYSPDGETVTISLTTKYSAAQRKYSVPFECLRDFIVDLQRLNAGRSAAPFETGIQRAVDSSLADDSKKSRITTAA
jgi:hypothetical protein